jgi:hypothetical protein
LVISSCSALNLLPSKKTNSIAFTQDAANASYSFIYQDLENSPELADLIGVYGLDSIPALGETEMNKVFGLLAWTNSRWEHSGSNQPSAPKAMTILQEAEGGMKFRCVEYGIVMKSVLAANGFYARTLGLKTRDVETTRYGAGHVLTEAWSNIHNKWFLLDAQFNVVPFADGLPLNAVEFQSAIVNGADYKLMDLHGEVSQDRREQYMKFIPPYLYYFDFKFDQREVGYAEMFKVNEKAILMLVPTQAKRPTVFQRKSRMDYLEYTHSLNDFYRKPI